MDAENFLPPWARQILIGVGLFLSGAILAFGYSYKPLHAALSWQVEQLETRLDERNRQNLSLRDALAAQATAESTRIDPQTLSQVQRDLEQTKRVLAQAEKDLKRAEGKRKDADASAARWRKRVEELENQPAPVAALSPRENPIYEGTAKSPASPSTATRGGTFDPEASASASGPSEGTSDSTIDRSRSRSKGERAIIPTEAASQPADH